MKIQVNNWCNVKTDKDTVNVRAFAEVTIPAFKANLSVSQAKELARCLLMAVAVAEEEIAKSKE